MVAVMAQNEYSTPAGRIQPACREAVLRWAAISYMRQTTSSGSSPISAHQKLNCDEWSVSKTSTSLSSVASLLQMRSQTLWNSAAACIIRLRLLPINLFTSIIEEITAAFTPPFGEFDPPAADGLQRRPPGGKVCVIRGLSCSGAFVSRGAPRRQACTDQRLFSAFAARAR